MSIMSLEDLLEELSGTAVQVLAVVLILLHDLPGVGGEGTAPAPFAADLLIHQRAAEAFFGCFYHTQGLVIGEAHGVCCLLQGTQFRNLLQQLEGTKAEKFSSLAVAEVEFPVVGHGTCLSMGYRRFMRSCIP